MCAFHLVYGAGSMLFASSWRLVVNLAMENTSTITNFVTLDGSATSQTFTLPHAPHNVAAKFQFGDVSGLQGTVSVSADGTTFFSVTTVTGGGTRFASGATVTVSDGSDLYFVSSGWKYARFSRSAGSGPVRLVTLGDTCEYEAALGAAQAQQDKELEVGTAAADTGTAATTAMTAPAGARWLELEHLSGTGVVYVNKNATASSTARVWPAMTVGMAFVGADRIPVVAGDTIKLLTSAGTSSLRYAFWGYLG